MNSRHYLSIIITLRMMNFYFESKFIRSIECSLLYPHYYGFECGQQKQNPVTKNINKQANNNNNKRNFGLFQGWKIIPFLVQVIYMVITLLITDVILINFYILLPILILSLILNRKFSSFSSFSYNFNLSFQHLQL